MAVMRWPTKLHKPKPDTASPTAAAPPAAEAAKTTLDISAKRICRAKIVFWMVHSALTGSSRNSTGPTFATSGMA